MLWSVTSYLLLPYVLVSLTWRALRYPAYWYRWPERFGFVRSLEGRRVIWVHAVSVGEVRSSAALIEALAERYPRHRLLVTTMTPTGSEQVQELFGQRVVHSYVPYDFRDAVNRFLDRTAPELAVIAETEFWPNLFSACQRRGIPLCLVNVRLSQASFRGYTWVGRTTRAMFANADLICAQTRIDAQRLRNLGVRDHTIEVTGNLKFDVEWPRDLMTEGERLRSRWGRDRPVWIAASTHPGEERRILDAFALLLPTYPDMLLVLVPRHPERFAGVVRLCRRRGYRVARRQHRLRRSSDQRQRARRRHHGRAAAPVCRRRRVLHRRQPRAEGRAEPARSLRRARAGHLRPAHVPLRGDQRDGARARPAARQVHDVRSLADAVSLYFEQPALRARGGQGRAQPDRGQSRRACENARTHGREAAEGRIHRRRGQAPRRGAVAVLSGDTAVSFPVRVVRRCVWFATASD